MQLATTMGFVLGKRNGKFMGLTPAETSAIHDGRWLKICMPARSIACFCLCASVFVFSIVRHEEVLTWGLLIARNALFVQVGVSIQCHSIPFQQDDNLGITRCWPSTGLNTKLS